MPEKFKPEQKEEKEQIEQLPAFLYENGGRLMTGMRGDSDVTQEYKNYLQSVGKKADTLPPFLYESGGTIYMGAIDDSNVTEDWQEWVKTLKPIESKKEQE